MLMEFFVVGGVVLLVKWYWLVLVVLFIGNFVIIFDLFIVNVVILDICVGLYISFVEI